MDCGATRTLRILLPLTLFLLLAAGAQGAVSGRADLCIAVGKLPHGVKLPGKNNPPGYIRLPPGIRYPGAVQCPSAGGTTGKPKPSAKPATFAGRVALQSGSVRAGVLAIHLPGGDIAGAGIVGAGGHYSVTVPSGTYALVPWIDGSKPTLTTLASALVHANPGAKRTLRLQTVLKKRRKTAVYRQTSGFGPPGFPTVPAPPGELWAVVDPFPPGPGEMGNFGRAMQAMLITDLVQQADAAKSADCNIKVSSLNFRIADLVNEIKLQQSPYVDPATRVPLGHWVEPNVEVRGTLAYDDAKQSVTGSVTVIKKGKSVGTASRTVGYDDSFDLSGLLAKDVVNLLCPRQPKAYDAALDGSARVDTGGGRIMVIAWKGTVHLTENADGPGPDGDTWRTFAPESGTLHVEISGDLGDCTISGSGDVSVTATAGLLAVDLDGTRHAYKPKLAWMGQSVPVTLSGGDSCVGQSVYVLGGAAWANDDSPPPSDSFLIDGSADWTIPGGLPATEHMHWVFTPR